MALYQIQERRFHERTLATRGVVRWRYNVSQLIMLAAHLAGVVLAMASRFGHAGEATQSAYHYMPQVNRSTPVGGSVHMVAHTKFWMLSFPA